MPKNLWQCLHESLEPAKDKYDYVIIDCPLGLSLFSSTALLASHYYISPVIPEPLSLQGVNLIQQRVIGLQDRYGAEIKFAGVILNIVKYYRATHQRIAGDLYGSKKDQYQPFHYWVPDNENLRRLGEFEPEISGKWAAGLERKFSSVYEKYGLTYRLSNPSAGPLSRRATEGAAYRLEERIERFVEEVQGRCT